MCIIQIKYGKIDCDGILFLTYSLLINESQSANVEFSSRYQQILDWCGKNFDGVIIFDESHKAKNLFNDSTMKPTKTGQTVLNLQDDLPNARIIYASATGTFLSVYINLKKDTF